MTYIVDILPVNGVDSDAQYWQSTAQHVWWHYHEDNAIL
jgi:hypothetical protein